MRRTTLAVLAFLVPACNGGKPSDADTGPTLDIGTVMIENGHRFETAGRAATVGRWELAEYEVGEQIELFEEQMPHAPLPPECDDQAADRMFNSLSTHELPHLRDAAHTRDMGQFSAAYARAAADCNGCHAVCRRPFVEVPTTPGDSVPRLDAVGGTQAQVLDPPANPPPTPANEPPHERAVPAGDEIVNPFAGHTDPQW